MKLNIPFETDESKSWYTIENAAKDGVWPLSYNGVWHTGIHFKAKQHYSLLRPFIPGEIVASRICDDYGTSPFNTKYSTSFVLMKHYFGSKRIPFYILYYGLGSKKVIEEQEYISYTNVKGEKIYRPLFCRKWVLKSDSVDIIPSDESHLPALYDNNVIKGYINRDGSYNFIKTQSNDIYFSTDLSKYYSVKCDSNKRPVGFNNACERGKYFSRKNETLDNETVDGKSGIWITLYYDSLCSVGYEKVKINIKNIARIEKKADGELYSIYYNDKDNRKKLYFEDYFYIITEKEIKQGTQIIRKNDTLLGSKNADVKILYYCENAVKTHKEGLGQKEVYNFVTNIKKCRCFEGDKLSITSVDNYDGKFQYKVKKESVSELCGPNIHNGYIRSSDYNFTTLYSYVYRYDSNKTNTGLPSQENFVKIYDDPSKITVGFTVYPSSCLDNTNTIYEILEKGNDYFALIKIKKINSPIYFTPALINETENYFYGYVKLNKEDFKSCIISSFKEDYTNFNSVVTGEITDIPIEYIGPIGIFDTNNNQQDNSDNDIENDFELHVELFTTSLDDFNFIKKKITPTNPEGVEEVLEITNTNDIKKADNECTINDAKNNAFIINNESSRIDLSTKIIKYYSNPSKGISPLYVKIYEKIIFVNTKDDEILVNSQKIKVRLTKSDNGNITKVQIKKKITINGIVIKKNDTYCCEYDSLSGDFYFLLEKDDFKSDYSIFYKMVENSSKEKPVELADDTIIYKGNIINLVPLSENETISTNSKTISFNNVQFIKIDNTDYFRIKINNNYYYIPEDKLDEVKCEKNYESETGETNNTVEPVESSKRYNVFNFPGFVLFEDSNDDYVCDVSEIAEKTGLKVGDPEQNMAELVYGNQDNALYKQLTRLIIKAPSMWEEPKGGWDSKKSDYVKNLLYWGLSDNTLNELYRYIENQFFIKHDNKKKIFGNKVENYKYYFFHPLKFLEYYSKKTLHENNPYCGEVIIVLPENKADSSMGGVNIVTDNPGFAPYDDKLKLYGDYPKPNGLFNENYSTVSDYYVMNYFSFYHEGLDIPANQDSEIKSFIYGEIVAWGWRPSYGRCTFILDNTKRFLYLLTHQHKYMTGIKKGLKIAPGDTVGYVGGSGSTRETNYGNHLHITKYEIEKDFATNCITNPNSANTSLKIPKITISDNDLKKLNSHRVNPLFNRATRRNNV